MEVISPETAARSNRIERLTPEALLALTGDLAAGSKAACRLTASVTTPEQLWALARMASELRDEPDSDC